MCLCTGLCILSSCIFATEDMNSDLIVNIPFEYKSNVEISSEEIVFTADVVNGDPLVANYTFDDLFEIPKDENNYTLYQFHSSSPKKTKDIKIEIKMEVDVDGIIKCYFCDLDIRELKIDNNKNYCDKCDVLFINGNDENDIVKGTFFYGVHSWI